METISQANTQAQTQAQTPQEIIKDIAGFTSHVCRLYHKDYKGDKEWLFDIPGCEEIVKGAYDHNKSKEDNLWDCCKIIILKYRETYCNEPSITENKPKTFKDLAFAMRLKRDNLKSIAESYQAVIDTLEKENILEIQDMVSSMEIFYKEWVEKDAKWYRGMIGDLKNMLRVGGGYQ